MAALETAHVEAHPALTDAHAATPGTFTARGAVASVLVRPPAPSCPYSPAPHVKSVPLAVSAAACAMPHEMATTSVRAAAAPSIL